MQFLMYGTQPHRAESYFSEQRIRHTDYSLVIAIFAVLPQVAPETLRRKGKIQHLPRGHTLTPLAGVLHALTYFNSTLLDLSLLDQFKIASYGPVLEHTHGHCSVYSNIFPPRSLTFAFTVQTKVSF